MIGRVCTMLGSLALVIVAFTATALAEDAAFDPKLLGEIHTSEQSGITVRTAVPGAAEVSQIFGVPVIEKGVQPVWVEIDNPGDQPLWYMPITTDETYFSPLEVAFRFHDALRPEASLKNSERFHRLAMPLAIPAGGKASGFVFTHVETGLKFLTFGMLKGGNEIVFRFVVPVAGPAYAGMQIDYSMMYTPDMLQPVDLAGLRKAIEALPCCTTNFDGDRSGDPLNLVIVGDGLDSLFPFISEGWRLTQPLDLTSAVETAKAFVTGTQFDTMPVSPLYAFGRPQDFALQKARSTINERNHMRVWLTPLRFEDRSVWIGQISRDIGVELTDKSWYLTTHKIGPEVDFDRDYLLQDMLKAGAIEHFGYAKGVGASTPEKPHFNLTDDPYFTDGLRLVMVLGKGGNPIKGVDALEWEPLPEPGR